MVKSSIESFKKLLDGSALLSEQPCWPNKGNRDVSDAYRLVGQH